MLLANRVGEMYDRPMFVRAASFYKIFSETLESINLYKKCGNSTIERLHNKQFLHVEQALMTNLSRWDKMKGHYADPRLCPSVATSTETEVMETSDGNGTGGAGSTIPQLPFPEKDQIIQMYERASMGQNLVEEHAKDLKKSMDETLAQDIKSLKHWSGGLPDGKNWMANVEDPPWRGHVTYYSHGHMSYVILSHGFIIVIIVIINPQISPTWAWVLEPVIVMS